MQFPISAELRRRFAEARRVLVLTGAGVSAESGVPTFRGGGNTAVWKGMPIEVISSGQMLERNLPAVWEWFDYRRGVLESSHPNPAHYEIARWQEVFPELTLVTQNVDGLHQKAGSSPLLVVEIHGTAREVTCLTCGERAPMERALARVRAGEEDPACRTCGGILKSATISFGQSLVAEDLRRAERAARACDLMLAIGTKLSVYPIAGVVPVAKESGARVVIVNAEPTEMDALADVVLRGSISALLPRLV